MSKATISKRDIIAYRRCLPESQPTSLYEPYQATVLRAPRQALVFMPHTLSEVSGPVYRHHDIEETDSDLTRQRPGAPLGERILVTGRVLNENGLPERHTLIEIWQANAAGRYLHSKDNHPAPIDPN